MNTKNVLIATVFAAAAASSAFAAEYVATAGNPEMQVSQVTVRNNVRPAATAEGVTATFKDGAAVVYSGKADSPSRAQVRAEARNWLNGPAGREGRALYFGGAQ